MRLLARGLLLRLDLDCIPKWNALKIGIKETEPYPLVEK